MMNGEPRLLLWNYSDEEKVRIDRFLEEIKAPPAVAIRRNQGQLLLKEIIHSDASCEQDFECDEKIVLFYNVPSKGMSILIDRAKKRKLPYPIYAAVTEHSINWSFHELARELVNEREAFRVAAAMKNVEAVIFDMDGVIADSEPLHLEAEKVALQARGIEAPWSEWHMFTGLPDEKIFRYIVDNFTDGSYSPEELMEAKDVAFMKILTEKVQPVPGVLDFIRRARGSFTKLALTTSSKIRTQKIVFEKFQLYEYFDVIVTGDHITQGKPHPEPYLKTIEKLGLPVELCVVFEDSVNGIKSAKEAGCKVIGVSTSFSRTELLQAGADAAIEDFEFFSEEE